MPDKVRRRDLLLLGVLTCGVIVLVVLTGLMNGTARSAARAA